MNKTKITEFKKYEKRIYTERTLQAMFVNAIIAASLTILVSLIVYFVDSKLFYLAIVMFFATLTIGTTITMIVRRPSNQEIARRIDAIGLNQQATTMLEFINDNSDIAKMQRERVKKLLLERNHKEIKITLNRKYWITAIVLSVIAVISVSLVGVSKFNGIPQYHDIQKRRMTKVVERKVIYEAEDGGRILGKLEQEIKDIGKPVYAIPNKGYFFIGWSDGETNPYRVDSSVKGRLRLKAMFRKFKVDETDIDERDKKIPQPEYEEQNFEGDKPSHIGGGSGKYEEINQIIDGKTYYRDVLAKYSKQELRALANDKSLPLEIRKLIEEYFKIIK